MLTKLFIVPVIAALLLTGTAYAVSLDSGQSAQLPETQNAAVLPQFTQRMVENPAAETTVPAQAPAETTAPAQETTAPTQSTFLTQEQAAQLAWEHAGVTADQVKGLHTEAELYQRIPHYDVEFRVEDWEYDYEIHAQTGQVLESRREYDPVRIPSVPQTQPTAPQEAPTQTAYLTEQEALALALAHAGLTEDAIGFSRVEFDWDDGVPQWDVEFRVDRWEYSYEIHAQSGKILEADKDWDD